LPSGTKANQKGSTIKVAVCQCADYTLGDSDPWLRDNFACPMHILNAHLQELRSLGITAGKVMRSANTTAKTKLTQQNMGINVLRTRLQAANNLLTAPVADFKPKNARHSAATQASHDCDMREDDIRLVTGHKHAKSLFPYIAKPLGEDAHTHDALRQATSRIIVGGIGSVSGAPPPSPRASGPPYCPSPSYPFSDRHERRRGLQERAGRQRRR
jgi:hypothetical protein